MCIYSTKHWGANSRRDMRRGRTYTVFCLQNTLYRAGRQHAQQSVESMFGAGNKMYIVIWKIS